MDETPINSQATQNLQKEQAFENRQDTRYTTSYSKPAYDATTSLDGTRENQKHRPHVYHRFSDEGKWRRRVKFAVFAVGVIVIGVILFVVLGPRIGINPLSTTKTKTKTTTKKTSVSISVEINAIGYDPHNATPIPLLAVSTDGDSTTRIVSSYDETGSHLKLQPGSYDITIPASPIGEDGTMFDVKDQVVHVEVPDSSAHTKDGTTATNAVQDSSTDAGSLAKSSTDSEQARIVHADGTLTLVVISDASQITDEMLENAQAYALELGVDKQTVEALVERVKQVKSDASTTAAAIEGRADIAKNFLY